MQENQTEEAEHRLMVKRAFIAASAYSLVYGTYEHRIVYHGPRLIDILGEMVNWPMMYIGLLITVGLATRWQREAMIFGLFWMAMFEDLVFFANEAALIGAYPYPAGNWWDQSFASFRVLGGLGTALPFFPYVPRYYVLGFPLAGLWFLFSYRSKAIGSKYAIVVAPLFIAIVLGTLSGENFAVFALLCAPIASVIMSANSSQVETELPRNDSKGSVQ